MPYDFSTHRPIKFSLTSGKMPCARRKNADTPSKHEFGLGKSTPFPHILGKPFPKFFPPGERLLLARFTKTRGLSDALVDGSGMGQLISLWAQAIPQEITNSPVVLSVDAVAFWPVISVHENGHVEGLKSMNTLDGPDRFPNLFLILARLFHS
jgi:hypothetical protein